MEINILFWEALFVISSVPARNYLFNEKQLKHKNKVWKLFKIKNETLERCQWHHSSVFIVNCEHISSFVLIFEFEQANICWVHIEKTNTFKNKIRYIMHYVVVFSVWKKISQLIPSHLYCWISEKFLQRSLLQTLILAKKMSLSFKMT